MKSTLLIIFATMAMLVFSACSLKDKKNNDKKETAKIITFAEMYHFKYHTIVQNLPRDCAGNSLEEKLYWLNQGEENLLRPIKVSLDDEAKIGAQVHQCFKEKAGFTEGADQQRVQAIVDKMKPFLTRKELNIKAYIVNLPYENAFACPGGYMYVTKPLLDAFSTDELACVIGHELSHLENKHCNVHIKKYKLMGGFLTNLLSIFTQSLSQRNELEADLGGVYLTAQAGYNPKGSVAAFNRWAAQEGKHSNLERLFRSHPYSSQRVMCIEAYLKDAKKKAENLAKIQ